MVCPVLILSHDTELANTLCRQLASRHQRNTEVYSQPNAAEAAIRRLDYPTTLVDLRLPWLPSLVETLRDVQASPSDSAGARLVPVGDGYYPIDLAATLDLLSVGNLDLANNGEAATSALGFLNGGGRSNGARRVPAPMVASAGDLAVTTYTPELFPLIDRLCRVAVHDVTVLFVGETGTGKTTLARLVHQLSRRRDEPFHNVACGALPRDLIESELFGHVRGAFTGADRSKIGRFEAAGRGTLLLDEIDVLGPKEQANLLRIIETGEYEMVGSTETRRSQARLIVASNVDLETLANERRFRSDLYYRLNVLEFRLPPLRERLLDIVPMAMQFVDECCRQHAIDICRVHVDFLNALKTYQWPGNIRELKNHIQRAVLFCENGELTVRDLSPTIATQIPSRKNGKARSTGSWSLADRVARSEREMIEEALRANNYKRTATARALGISRVGLYKKMKRFGMLEAS